MIGTSPVGIQANTNYQLENAGVGNFLNSNLKTMSQQADCVSFLTRLMEIGHYEAFDTACAMMEIFVDYETCLEIVEQVETYLKAKGEQWMDPVFTKIRLYRAMIS